MLRTAPAFLQLSALFFATFALAACSSGVKAADMTSTLIVGGSHIDVTVDGKSGVADADILAWVQAAAESVATYYGRYPVPHLTLRITPFSGHGVRHGQTFGMRGGFIKIGLGNDTTKDELMNDWMMTHEMIHLAFPSVADEHHWIEEGISTYVEPIARIRASHMKEEQMWADLVRDMPKGQPQAGDKGLDHTPTWGRTYWGGALFCFDADVEIRKKTQNKKGLQDALRGILDAGGNITNDWDLAQAFRIGDQSTGTTVLTDLYNQMKDHPVSVDLAEKWKLLGIERNGSSVHLRDDAPGTAIRRAITGVTSQAQSSTAPTPADQPLNNSTPSPNSSEPIATSLQVIFAGRKFSS
jgi:hypothetical protein